DVHWQGIDPVFQAKEGTYWITFRVAEEPATTVTVRFVVSDGDEEEHSDKFQIIANNVYLNVAAAKAFINAGSNFIAEANAHVQTIDGSADIGTVDATHVVCAPAFSFAEGTYQVTFRIAEEPATTVTVAFVVSDRYRIYADDAVKITLEDVKVFLPATDGDYIDLAHAYARDLDGEPTGIFVKSSTLTAAEGVYDVVFAVTADDTITKTTRVAVLDGIIGGNDEYAISANHVAMTVTQAAEFLAIPATSDNYVSRANAHALKIEDGSVAPVRLQQGSAIKAQPGDYFITFEVIDDPSATVTVKFIIEDGHVIDNNNKYVIVGNNVFMTVAEAQDFIAAGASDAAYLKAAKVRARITEGTGTATPVKGTGSIEAAEDIYPVEFYVGQDPTVAISVNFVVKDGDVIDGDERYALSANHVFMTLDEAKAFLAKPPTGADYVAEAQADAIKHSDPAGSATAQWVLGSIYEFEGIYPVTFAVAEDPAVSVTVNFVVMEGDVIDGNPRYALAASHVYMTTAEAAAFLAAHPSGASYVARANAHAKKIDGLPGSANAQWKSGTISVAEDIYPVTFEVAQDPGVFVTVNFVVMDGDVIDGNPRYSIAASYIYMTVDETAAFLAGEADYIGEAKAHALRISDGALATVQWRSGVAEALEGVYPITFEVGEDSTVACTVNFIVMNGDEIDGSPRYAITAYHVKMTEAQAAVWLASGTPDYVSKANAHAITTNDSTFIPTVLKVAGIMEAKAGVYPVTFAVQQDSKVRVTVNFEVTAGPYCTISYYSYFHTSGSVPAPTTHLQGSTATIATRGSLAREGYTFGGWAFNNPYGSIYTDATHWPGATTTVNGHMNLYAVWVANQVTPPPPPPPPPPNVTTIVYPPAGPTVYVPQPSETTILQTQPPTLTPQTNINPQQLPESKAAAEDKWSLVNLICTLLLALVFLFGLIRFVQRKRVDSDDPLVAEGWGKKRYRHSWITRGLLLVGIVATLAELVLFVLTQNLVMEMTLFDEFSALFIALLALGSVSTIALFVSAYLSKTEVQHLDEPDLGDEA
ncbi:MAG: InlB B-repeat-containing protein, partial [Coriobacteriales bacterium]|nr:InlB B-repeat-containing protein [Coriobacteriales bacterium]